MPKYSLKLGLKLIFSAAIELRTELNITLWFQTEVERNYPVFNLTCTMHSDRQFH